jgi:hypothetical protein
MEFTALPRYVSHRPHPHHCRLQWARSFGVGFKADRPVFKGVEDGAVVAFKAGPEQE